MNNSSSTSPEHDEKTGSFAPRTSGSTTQEKPKSKWPRRRVVISAGALIVAIVVYCVWILPSQVMGDALKQPAGHFFAAIESLNQEEASNGQGTAAEPPLETREEAERSFKATLAKFTDIQGILTPCVLTGHDVHVIDPSGRILLHFMTDEEVPAPFTGVRDVFAKLPAENEHVVLLRSGKFEAYAKDGTLISL